MPLSIGAAALAGGELEDRARDLRSQVRLLGRAGSRPDVIDRLSAKADRVEQAARELLRFVEALARIEARPGIRTVCAWCRSVVTEGDAPEPVSHVICKPCQAALSFDEAGEGRRDAAN